MSTYLKINRIKFTILFLLIYIFLLPLFDFLLDNAVYYTLGVLAFLGSLSLIWNKYWIDSVICLVLIIALGLAKLRYGDVEDWILLLRSASVGAFILLSFTLLIGPWSRFTKIFLDFYKHRRHIGVTTFFIALTHANLVLVKMFGSNLDNLLSVSFIFFGITTLFIMSFMAATSWNYLQKHLNYRLWSLLHSFLLIIYIGLVYIFYTKAGDILPSSQKILPIVFLILWILFAPWSLPRFILPALNGWKQLHVLIYIAYISLIVHAWYAAISYQPTWIKFGFIGVVSLVIASHALGWIKMLIEYITTPRYLPYSFTKGTYYKLDKLENFEEGVGRKFTVNKVPVAVFKYEDKIIALSNICAHQNGPIYKGKIINGYIECPWHNWQYSIENGCGPKGYSDCIPYFPTLIKENDVYISLKRIPRKKQYPSL